MGKQKGFSTVEAIIIIVVVGLVGFLGWWVYKSQSKSESEQSQTSNQQEEQTNVDETADWKSYSNADLGISLNIRNRGEK